MKRSALGLVLLVATTVACKPPPTVSPAEPASNAKPDGAEPSDLGPGPIQPEAPPETDAAAEGGEGDDESAGEAEETGEDGAADDGSAGGGVAS